MPPRVKTTKEAIIAAAMDIVRKNGVHALNARSIAAALNCSTQPVFSNFASMEELQKAVEKSAHELYFSFLQNDAAEGLYPPYKAFGMAYIRFAKEERELFKMLFMSDKNGVGLPQTVDTEASVEMIMQANNITKEAAELMHMEMWIFVHGIASMVATSFLTLPQELISNMITDVYQGVRSRYAPKENL